MVVAEGEDEDDSSYVWRDVSWMNVANTCWMGVGRRERKKMIVSEKDKKKKRKQSIKR